MEKDLSKACEEISQGFSQGVFEDLVGGKDLKIKGDELKCFFGSFLVIFEALAGKLNKDILGEDAQRVQNLVGFTLRRFERGCKKCAAKSEPVKTEKSKKKG